jgi:hypothetical protein
VGLGLTLVASVAKVHGGALELGDNHPGLRANMVISAQTAGALHTVLAAAGGAGSPGLVSAHPVGQPAAGSTGATAASAVDGGAGGTAVPNSHNLRIRSVN